MKNRLVPWILVLLCLTGIVGYQALRWAQAPVADQKTKPPVRIVVIPEGSTFQYVAGLLKRERLIKSRAAFVLLGKTKTADRKIHPGEYELNAAMSAEDILSKLLSGRVVLHPVTIPEGFTMTLIAELLGQLNITIERSSYAWDAILSLFTRLVFRQNPWKDICSPRPIILLARPSLKTSCGPWSRE